MTSSLADRIDAIDWQAVATDLDGQGWALVPGLLSAADCAGLRGLYDGEAGFRKQVVMERHGYGRGEYKYFSYPLPEPIADLRAGLYPPLARIANGWNASLGIDARFPDAHAEFLRRCHEAGQQRPTPLLLRYGPGDYNHLHQDLYGEQVFPLQATFLLSSPEADFTGGEFVLTEQRARMQSRVEVVPLRQGDGVIFPVNLRPVRSVRGVSRAVMRHGVSRLRSGARLTLGVILHDAA